jgi:hypothetical protein
MGHQSVNADWKRFNPTKAVKMSQYPEWTHESTRLKTINVPAISLKYLSTCILILLSDFNV